MSSKTDKPVLIASTSGVRGIVGNGLDPIIACRYAAAFGSMLKRGKVVVGRDTRPSGEMLIKGVTAGLISVGCDVIDIGIVPTPTLEIAVAQLKASGGVCITASHNPAQWNALKFFGDGGEFITSTQFKRLSSIYTGNRFAFKKYQKLGVIDHQSHWVEEHIRQTLAQKVIRIAAIRRRRFTVVVDAINGAGSYALPELLRRLGARVIEINCKGDGDFVHEPEPKPENLEQLGSAVKRHRADLGMACDPDADRLALVDENGQPISEEFTLTIGVSEVLKKRRGPTVINLSTSRVTEVVARAHASRVFYAPVGEAKVAAVMRSKKAVIGGEGNGGLIFPEFHTGRDALIAAALVLSALAGEKRSLSSLVETFPVFYIKKSKAAMPDNFPLRLRQFAQKFKRLFKSAKMDSRDGLRFDFAEGWVQVRKSNTEPIFRVIVETTNRKMTNDLTRSVMEHFQ